ncbi:unnamed protein product [Ectocarpus sp. 12 AP-2014]
MLTVHNFAQVPKNAKGGILVCEEELKAAFDFFDVEGKGVITAGALRKKLGAFHRSLSAREARVLMNNKAEMTMDDLREVLLENEVTNFDPVTEAFKAYDPSETGFMDTEILRSIFDNLGFGKMSDEDLAILVEAADGDGDGRVGISDFREMCGSVGKREAMAANADNQAEDADQAKTS